VNKVSTKAPAQPARPQRNQWRRPGQAVWVLFAGLALGAAVPSAAEVAAQKPGAAQQHPAQAAEAPANPQSAAQSPPSEPGERAAVTGFRSARWGMTEAQVKAAIQKDFNIPPDKVQAQENLSERTTVLATTVDDLLEGAGKARVSYILGHATKKLIQVNIVWGTGSDPQVKPERVVAGANQLRTLFLSSGYEPATVISNVSAANGAITVFQGEDADKHMTVLRLIASESQKHSKQQRKGDPQGIGIALLLSYVQDARNPDVYRLKKGRF
jgi:hypothetical protein